MAGLLVTDPLPPFTNLPSITLFDPSPFVVLVYGQSNQRSPPAIIIPAAREKMNPWPCESPFR